MWSSRNYRYGYHDALATLGRHTCTTKFPLHWQWDFRHWRCLCSASHSICAILFYWFSFLSVVFSVWPIPEEVYWVTQGDYHSNIIIGSCVVFVAQQERIKSIQSSFIFHLTIIIILLVSFHRTFRSTFLWPCVCALLIQYQWNYH